MISKSLLEDHEKTSFDVFVQAHTNTICFFFIIGTNKYIGTCRKIKYITILVPSSVYE